MSIINVLDKKVYMQIAAGEVVERPSSVVKELIENSIDAGATSIKISIFNGGKDCIEVSDNGSGILKDDLLKTVLPHATSKIKDTADLDAIRTLGFRGEALASIASVSKLRITTKTKNDELGYSMEVNGGDEPVIYECPSNMGTFITVSNLFYNTPARQKFLKSDRSEENDVTDTVTRLVLANPNVAFEYEADNDLVLKSYGEGIEDAINAVYGNAFLNECFKISNYLHGVKIEGYIGKINYTKPNRTYQTVILNGRYVVNATIQSAVHNAYFGYLMKRRYPVFVLSITIPNEIVDVNVTPNKSDVRFMDNSVIYGAIYTTISKVLDGTDTALNIITPPGSVIYKSPEAVRMEANDERFKKLKDEIFIVDTSGSNIDETEKYKPDKFPDDIFSSFRVAENEFEAKKAKKSDVEDVFAANKRYIEELEMAKTEKASQVEIKTHEPLKYIGQALNTYLLFERESDLFIIDQHAAHERLLYNKLLNKRATGEKSIQPLLVPYCLTLNTLEEEYVAQKLNFIKDIGIDISPATGGGYNIYAVPLELVDIDFDKFFEDVLHDYSLKRETIPEVINEKLIQKACKSAVKAGMKLSDSEVKSLMRLLDGNIDLKCPHGRPIAVKITRYEIDKWFKRIL